MRVFRFDASAGQPVGLHGSAFILSRIARPSGDVRIGCMHVEAGGSIGYHQTTVPQLALVVGGAGWVRGEHPEKQPIVVGQAVFWEGGEWHAAGTDDGMMLIVIEATTLDPSLLAPFV